MAKEGPTKEEIEDSACDEAQKEACDVEGECCKAKKDKIEECCSDMKGCPNTNLTGGDLRSHKNNQTYYENDVSGLSTQKKDGEYSDKDCFYARKCILHAKEDTEKKSKPNKCCTSQTGHHIVPDAAMKSSNFCYDYNKALTVCVAGAGNRVGNHGLMHLRLCKILKDKEKKILFEKLVEYGVQAVKETIGGDTDCDWACMEKEIIQNHIKMGQDDEGKQKKECKNELEESSQIDKHCGMGYEGGKLDKIEQSIAKVGEYTIISS